VSHVEIKYVTDAEVLAGLEQIHAAVQEKFHDQWDWFRAAFYVEVLRTRVAENAKLRADNKALLEIVKFVEWRGHNQVCPVCHGSKYKGHGAMCDIRKSLAEHSEPQ
jgi:hypothetical protein